MHKSLTALIHAAHVSSTAAFVLKLSLALLPARSKKKLHAHVCKRLQPSMQSIEVLPKGGMPQARKQSREKRTPR